MIYDDIKDTLTKDPALLNSAPCVDTIKKIMGERDGYARKAYVTSVDFNTGDPLVFSSDEVSYEDLAIAAMGSASIPVVFPPQ